jgi:hypothetical protein
MTTEIAQITPEEFVEKYKLIPKQLRIKFLEFLRQMPYIYDIDDWKLDVFDSLMLMLVWYDEDLDYNNYTFLVESLKEDVYHEECQVYYDVIGCLLRYLKWKVPLITSRDVYAFHKLQMLKQIKEEVAYRPRPGNPGYESVKASFEKSFNQISVSDI